MRVAIIGSRTIKEFDRNAILAQLPKSALDIISGGARGVDALAEQIAREQQLNFAKFLPDYKTYGKNAPLVRNQAIVESADLVLAVWDYASRGTADVIARCIASRVPVRIIGAQAG